MDTLIISCCARKLGHAAPAIEIYQNRAWKYVRENLADRFNVMALSAEHSLVPADRILEPYDRKMDERRASKIAEEWHQGVRPCSMLSAWNDTGSARFYVYGGRVYRDLVKFWCASMPKAGWECIEVIGQGRGCGDHYKALTEL